MLLLVAAVLPVAGAQAHKAKPKPKPKWSPVVLATQAPKNHGPVVQTTLTTFDEHYALRAMPPQYFAKLRTKRRLIVVNDAVRYQKIIGFGGAMTDSSAWLLQDELTSSQRNRIMRLLFSPTEGIGLSVTRVPIGGSDFTATGVPYTYDDSPNTGQTCSNPSQGQIPCDPSLTDFSIAHDQAYIIPALTEMRAQNPAVKVLATEWSPPAWMKANDRLDDINGSGTLLPEDYGPLANYLAKFVSAYQALGIPIWAITPENEPQSGAKFPAMSLPEPQEAQFITQNLVPTLRQAGLHTRIYGYDGTDLSYGEALEQSSAGSHLAGMAWHCYGGQQTIGQFHQAYPNVVNLTSECSPGIIPYSASEAALSGLNNFSSLIQLWNLALNPAGGPVQPPNSGCHRCTGLVRVNPETRKATLRRSYYQLGQFSKFIRPGARRIEATRTVTEFTSATGPHYGVSPGLDDAAFVDPGGRRVLVVYNNSPLEQYFAVRWDRQTFAYRMPGKATVTFTWRPNASGGASVGP
jgi:glucosylceramidase